MKPIRRIRAVTAAPDARTEARPRPRPAAAAPEAAAAASPDVEFLRRGRWFSSLPAELQTLILDRSIERAYRKGTRLVREGAPVRGLFALLEGRVHVVRGVGDADEALIHVGEPGFWFGEHSMLSGKPAIASIVATANVRVLLLPGAEFQRIVTEEPRYFALFARLLLERYATVFRYASEARALAAEDWLWSRLQDLAAIRRREAQVTGPVDVTVSQTELATMVGVSRQTLCMLLGRLQERGRVGVSYRRIRIL